MSADTFEMNLLKRSAPTLVSIESRGYEVFAPEDFDAVPELVAQTGRAKQTPMLSVTENDFTAGSAFYLFLLHEGQAVGGAAARLIDLRDESFGSYLRRSSRIQYSRTIDPIERIAKPVVDDLKGKLIYLGELEFSKDHRGGAEMLGGFVRILQALSAAKWPEFDWMYSFVPKNHAKLSALYGFSWQMPDAITWRDPIPEGRRNDHWMLAVSRSHFSHIWGVER